MCCPVHVSILLLDCGNPPQFGEPVTYDDTTFQAEATYYCLDGPVKKVCDGYGTWQPEGNQCLTVGKYY